MGTVVTIIIIIAIVAIFYFFCCYKKQKSLSGGGFQGNESSSGVRPDSDSRSNTASVQKSSYLTSTMTRGRSLHIEPRLRFIINFDINACTKN
uniref:Uncharacterized protein n=1 Tax=Onchocerca volvulus TaxID=6282 RepID=A0A8R1XNX0_ONCVO